MSDIQDLPTGRVLHIRPSVALRDGETGASAVMEALLRSVLPSVDASDNIYDGLASMYATDAESLRAVVVCMDCVEAAEMEFFTLVSRLRKGVAVYVYGGNRHEERIAAAIKLGARGQACESAIRRLAGDMKRAEGVPTVDSVPADPLQPPEGPLPVVVTDDLDDELTEDAWAEDDDAEDLETVVSADEGADKDDSAFRVPWLRYADSPRRTAPPRTAPISSSIAHDDPLENTDAPAAPHEPLLTDAELQALIGDDIAAIAPQSPAEPAPDHSDDLERPK